MITIDTLTTDRLVLRRWRDADREPFAALNADPEVMRHFVAPLDRAASDAFVDRMEHRHDEQGFGLWAVERVDDGVLLGFTGLNPVPDGVPHAGGMEIGWRYARHAWGHGYATEAARAAVEAARRVGLPELWSFTAVTNEASQRVMQRIGMRFAVAFEHPSVPVDHPLRPHVQYHLPLGSGVGDG